jgi:threonine aldolase
MVDLRSDTVTRPTPAMRRAMAEAEVGDDVFGEDPTILRLEAAAAERAGKEAALFVTSGSMANLIAISIHTRAGDEVLMHQDAHPFNYETGGAAAYAGVQIRPLPGPAGILDPAVVGAAVRGADDHEAPARLLSVDDTPNRGGGSVHPLVTLDELAAVAAARGMAAHMDGARVFNAVVASGVSLARRARGFDTVGFCFSKGLGAPVGSALCGTRDAIAQARRVRKRLGGGMRQGGILAAGALYALAHHVDRLADDHARARQLAEGLRALGYSASEPATNLVFVDVPDARRLVAGLGERGVKCFATGPARVRLVTHLDVDDAGVTEALSAFAALGRLDQNPLEA